MKTITKDELTKKLGEIKSIEQGSMLNAALIKCEHGTIVQSYSTWVAAMCNGKLYLFPKHAFSNTTNKHIIFYYGLNKQARIKALENEVAISVTE